MKRPVIILLTLLFFAGTAKSQYDPLYNQYNFDQVMINPAYAGFHNMMSFSTVYRQQWAGLEGAPQTFNFAWHTSFAANKAGIGTFVVYDQFGINKNTEAYIDASWKIDFTGSKLSIGLQGGILDYRYDYASLNFDPNALDDPSFRPLDERITQANFGVGVFYGAEKYYIGFSIPRILDVEVDNASNVSTSRYQRHYYFSAGYIAPISETLKLKGYTLVRIVENVPANFDLGVSLLINELIWAGLIVRDLDALAFLGQVEISDRFRAGLSVEIPTTTLVTNSYGTYELMLSYTIAPFNRQLVTRRYY